MRLVDLFDNFMIDLDGVVYIGSRPIDGAVRALNTLRAEGKAFIFITNDPRASAADYAKKLSSIGIPATPRDVITSATALAGHIRANFSIEARKAYVVGTEELKKEIEAAGLRVCDEGEEAKSADFVIVGGHTGFNYEQMKTAALAVRRGARFFATNRDAAFPTPEGMAPATGAILASIEVASSQRAVAVGKPEPVMFEEAARILANGARTAVIGDRLDTDIRGGMRAGYKTILVLSGSTTEADLLKSDIKPDYVIRDLGGLLEEV